MSAPAPVHVTGGVGGLTVNRDELLHLAALLRSVASSVVMDLLVLTNERHRIEVGPFADGPGRLDLAGGAQARLLIDSALDATGKAQADAADTARKLGTAAFGYPWGSEIGTGAGLLDAMTKVSVGIVSGVTMPWGALTRRERYLTEHPGYVDSAAREVLDGLEKATRDEDGIGVALPGGVVASTAPRGLADLMRSLDQRNRTGVSGGIDIRIMTTPDGRRAVIVNITGTREWGRGGRSVADLDTNVRAVMGRTSAYSQGVFAAMKKAGVRPDDQVMLVGHSQGGMIAVNVARDAERTGAYRVTHVVTAGAPIGIDVRSVPRTVRVLALENSNDIVPHVDAAENVDRRNVTTVKGGYNTGTVAGNHSIGGSYVPIADGADRSGNRSVREFERSGRVFFSSTCSRTHVFQVVRR